MMRLLGLDSYIAFFLIAIVVVILLISRMSALPKKTLPFIAAGIAAAFGLSMFRSWRAKSLTKDFSRKQHFLKKKERELSKLKEQYAASEQEMQEASAELESVSAAYEKSILLIKTNNQNELDRIDQLSGRELHEEFRSKILNN